MKTLLIGIIAAITLTTTAEAARHRHHEATHRQKAVPVYGHIGPIPVLPLLDSEDEQVAKATQEQATILAACSYSETPCRKRPADIVAAELSDLKCGSARLEIRRVAGAFGFSVGLMNAIARIESDFNPHERTGSYIGLFQLSQHEFAKYGPLDGSILNARDNAIAAAAKIEDEDAIFAIATRHVPTDADTYLIHQQGLQGAAQHLADPNRTAWRSMCATDEGREKGQGWCRRAIWGNTLPAVKRLVHSVENLTSETFVAMWANRVAAFLGKPIKPLFYASNDKDKDANDDHAKQPHRAHRTYADKHHERVVHRFVKHVRYAHHLHHRHLARA